MAGNLIYENGTLHGELWTYVMIEQKRISMRVPLLNKFVNVTLVCSSSMLNENKR